MRKAKWLAGVAGVFVAGFLVVMAVLFGNNSGVTVLGAGAFGVGDSRATNKSLGTYEVPVELANTARPLGEVGPGECWPAKQFTSHDGPAKAGDWLASKPDSSDEVQRYDKELNRLPDYYLIYEVVPEWKSMPPAERVASYFSQLVLHEIGKPIKVQNTYCAGPDVKLWDVQVLPAGEPVLFVPGHEPGDAEPRPVIKAVCGNMLPPLTAPPPSGSVTTNTPPTGGTGGPPPNCTDTGGCTPTQPVCKEKPCVPTTPSCPPGSTKTECIPPKKQGPQPPGVQPAPQTPHLEPPPQHGSNDTPLKPAPTGQQPPPQVPGATPITTPRQTPPTETPAQPPSNPGTGGNCPPGKTTC